LLLVELCGVGLEQFPGLAHCQVGGAFAFNVEWTLAAAVRPDAERAGGLIGEVPVATVATTELLAIELAGAGWSRRTNGVKRCLFGRHDLDRDVRPTTDHTLDEGVSCPLTFGRPVNAPEVKIVVAGRAGGRVVTGRDVGVAVGHLLWRGLLVKVLSGVAEHVPLAVNLGDVARFGLDPPAAHRALAGETVRPLAISPGLNAACVVCLGVARVADLDFGYGLVALAAASASNTHLGSPSSVWGSTYSIPVAEDTRYPIDRKIQQPCAGGTQGCWHSG